MNTKHTPGPWRVTETALSLVIRAGEPFMAGYSYPEVASNIVAEVPTGQEKTSTLQANARLIAKAPEMLGALQEATTYLLAHLPKGNIRDSAHFHALNEHACLVKQLRAIINEIEEEA